MRHIQPLKWQLCIGTLCTNARPQVPKEHKEGSAITASQRHITFDPLGLFKLLLTFRISPFEVKVASLHTGLWSYYPIISANLNNKSAVLRSDQIALHVNHRFANMTTLGKVCCETTLIWYSSGSVQRNYNQFTNWKIFLPLSVISLRLSSWAAGRRRLLAAGGLRWREAAGACQAHRWDRRHKL